MTLSLTRYVSFFNQFKVPALIYQKRKYVFDRELNDTQWLRMQDGWRQNSKNVGENVVREGLTLTINGSNPSLIDISPFECVFSDGIASYSEKLQNLDVSELTAGTYDVVASVTYITVQSDVDADLKDPTYGQETTAMIEQILTLSVLAATPENKTLDTSLSVVGSIPGRILVKSTNSYDANKYSLGCIEMLSGQKWAIEDQQDDTPLPGQTTFTVDPGPNQSGLAFTVGVGAYLVLPNPIYGPIRTSAVRYIKLGEVVVVGTPPAATVSAVTVTADTYKSNKDMRSAFVAEHEADGTHGPNISLTTTSGTPITIINSGLDPDVVSNFWNVDALGNALFNKVSLTDKMVSIFTFNWSASSAAQATGALGFTPRVAFALMKATAATSVGFAIGTGTNAKLVSWRETYDADTTDYGNAYGDSAIAGASSEGTTQTNALLNEIDVTAWSESGIELTPSASVTARVYLLVIG